MTDLTAPDAAANPSAAKADRGDVIKKVGWRLMPFVALLYFMAILDRGNVSFAAISMNHDLGLNSEMFGISIGIMYFTYSLFEVPSNLILGRFGARVTLTRIAILWGIATMLMAFTQGPLTLYTFRGLLGLAESGLFPGVMLYLSLWFPFRHRARTNAIFNYAVPTSYLFAAIISGFILELDGTLGLAGWKWLFILEGAPSVLLGIIGIFYLTDRPTQAKWLAPDERTWLQGEIDADARKFATIHSRSFARTLMQPIVLLFAGCYFGIFCGLASLFAWLPQIVRSHGLPASQVGLITAIPALAGLLAMVGIGTHSDKIGERFVYTIGTLALAAAGFALAAFAITSLPLVILGFMMATAGIYGTQAVFWTIPQSYLSRESAPGAIGLISTAGSIGGAIIPIVIGRIKDASGAYTGGFLCVSGVLLLAIVFILAARTKLHRRPA